MAFDVPSNLALKRFGSIWLAILVTAFGAITIGGAFVKTYRTFVVTRVLLGIAESGTLVRICNPTQALDVLGLDI